jgi:hypothetical protein
MLINLNKVINPATILWSPWVGTPKIPCSGNKREFGRPSFDLVDENRGGTVLTSETLIGGDRRHKVVHVCGSLDSTEVTMDAHL